MKTKFSEGTIFHCNRNNLFFEVVKIEKRNATVRELLSGAIYTYGLRALEELDVTIIRGTDDGKE